MLVPQTSWTLRGRDFFNIGPGDLAYVVGVFKLLPGTKRNNPVVHVGHLASFAEGEKIATFDWRSNANPPPELLINGYLVQVDTMPQASGSPVFVRRSIKSLVPDPAAKPERVDDTHAKVPLLSSAVYGSIWLLGLWHGAWTDDVSKMLALQKGTVNLGMGMGVTIPAPRIMEVLNRPELVAMRQAAKEKKGPTLTPQADSRAAAKVRDEMLRTLLSTPPQPRKKSAKKRVKST